LIGFFVGTKSKKTPEGKTNLRAIGAIYAHSTLLIVNHYTLLIMGIVEIFNSSTYFYNVFCTFLYVVDPCLIFITTVSLLFLFYIQASKRYKDTQNQDE
jgi:hypothetical protein